MKAIPLTQGKVVFVDNADFEWLSRWKWCAKRRKRKNGVYWYACRTDYSGERQRTVLMHREIAAVVGIPETDHCDGNGLNNQRFNLRPATASQNQGNQRKSPGFSSRFKGVSWKSNKRKWRAQIKVARAIKHLGYFNDEISAAKAYDGAAIRAFGEFALLNLGGSDAPGGVCGHQDVATH